MKEGIREGGETNERTEMSLRRRKMICETSGKEIREKARERSGGLSMAERKEKAGEGRKRDREDRREEGGQGRS